MSERDHRASLRALRKTNLARLLARRPEGIFVSAITALKRYISSPSIWRLGPTRDAVKPFRRMAE
jgi:hypothetical protein